MSSLWTDGSIVSIAGSALDAVIAHARRVWPAECCGLLVGTGTTVTEASPAQNIADKPTRFLVDPQDHFNAIRWARQRGLEVLGFYHSHPRSSALPSETDRAEANYPDHLYLIVGLASEPPEVRIFGLADGNFRELSFVTLD